jgi:hypothetical protein
MESPLEKVLEAAISYEQVLLSQISYCSKLTNLISETISNEGVQYLRNSSSSLMVCVKNLITLLPKDLRLRVFKREAEIRKRIADYASKYECLKRDTCKEEEIYAIESAVRRAILKEFPEYAHVIDFPLNLVIRGGASSVGMNLFRLALAVDVLMEEGVIGLKRSSLFVGRVGVPEQPDQGGLRE